MKAHLAYLKYVIRHKWFVFQACLKWRVPLWLAITHDWSKFSFAEWFPYVHYFYGDYGSKFNGGFLWEWKESAHVLQNFDLAWLHHQKHNPHHWQFWLLVNDEDGIRALEMPEKYLREMLADWEGAGRAITGKSDPAGWYRRNYDKFIFHDGTRQTLERLLELA